MRLLLDHLNKRFGNFVAVNDLNLDIRDGEFVALLGPSGCGKTTTLLMLAGIYKPSDGQILFGNHVVNTVPPKDRNIGMVFQSYALYPHMTVFQNIAYPLRLQRVPKREMRERAQRIADKMGIGHLMDRRPGQLSGGQQQRVALGRALVKTPNLLLFDEPLSNLDARLRLTMRAEIKRLQLELGITSVYVTHDQVEAMTMADRIAVMNDGNLEAFAPPEELYERPRTLFVANFIGNPPINLLDVVLRSRNGSLYAEHNGHQIEVAPERASLVEGARNGERAILGIRPEDVELRPEGAIRGEVYIVEPLGRDDLVEVTIGETRVTLLTPANSGLRIGDSVRLGINSRKVQLFDPGSKQSLLWR